MTFSFDNTPKYCINLKSRRDRADAVTKELRAHGIDFEFFEGVEKKGVRVPKDSPKRFEYNAEGILACAASHIAIISIAKKLGHAFVCIFEDDIELAEDFNLRMLFLELSEQEFDLVYLGGHFDDMFLQKRVFEPYIYRLQKTAGSYAYIIRNTLYDYILDTYNQNYGWDEFLATFVQPNFQCIAFLPFLVGHKDDYSDVAEHYVQYNCNGHFQKEKIQGLCES